MFLDSKYYGDASSYAMLAFDRRHLFSLLIASLINLSSLFAQSSLSDTIAISEVVVRSARDVVSQQRLTHDALRSLPSNNIADALKYMAGVQIKDYGGLGGQKTVNVRSLGSQHVGVYIDGVRITNVQNGTVDLGKYSLSTLESVSLYNANKNESLMMASEYASASTIYLQSHRPDSSSCQLSASVASFNTYKANATIAYKRYALLDCAFTTTKGDYPFEYHTQYEDTTGRRSNSDFKMCRIEGSAFLGGLSFHAYYYNSERGLPGGIVRRLSGLYTDVGREWDRNLFAQMAFRKRFDSIALRSIVKYSNDYLHYRSDYDNNIAVHSNNKYRQQDLYGAVASSYDNGNWSLSASSDLRWSDLKCMAKTTNYITRVDSKSSLAIFYSRGLMNFSSSALFTYVADHHEDEKTTMSHFAYNALFSWRINKWTLRSFYKSVFRVPTLNDLYYNIVGNSNLKPEYTKQLDVGATYNSAWFDVQCDFYYNRIDNRIVALPLKGSYQWTMLNYGRTRCLGVDISAKMNYKWHSLFISGTFQDDRNKTNPKEDAYNDYVAYSPRLSLSAIYSLQVRRLTASLSHIFVDKRYWTTENAIEEPLEAYNCTDVKVGFSLHPLSVEVECKDIFDVRYEMIQRWPMPGRRFSATLKFEL
mgnify:CR=1 FL=1